jgi:para-aminobenzoate synthetase component 1
MRTSKSTRPEHVRIIAVFEIKLSADQLVANLLRLSESEPIYFLDSCGVGHLGSHLLIAGVRPVEILELTNADPEDTLRILDEKLSHNYAAIFTLSYDFGTKLSPPSGKMRVPSLEEPDVCLALFDSLIVHDYDSSRTSIVGERQKSSVVAGLIQSHSADPNGFGERPLQDSAAISNFAKEDYIEAVRKIQEAIRDGDTYQTNLTQQLSCALLAKSTPQSIYWRLRRDHPAPFSAFLKRSGSTVISASPERFFRTTADRAIESSPIKGTRRRGASVEEDELLRAELLSSAKDRAENTMIVDLVRNDLGRVCEFGSVTVEKLCDLEEHPTLFHLVSTVRGRLRDGISFAEIIRAVFPCGSITGAPKIRTMRIIEEIENSNRGLSMGAIGVYLPEGWNFADVAVDSVFDLSVAIRTMVIRDGVATFNVGGGVVIDSDPEKEYDESLLKARALLTAIGASLTTRDV